MSSNSILFCQMEPDEHLTVTIAPVWTGNFVSVRTPVQVAGKLEHSSEVSRVAMIDNDTVIKSVPRPSWNC